MPVDERWWFVVLLLTLVGLFFAFDLGPYLNLATIKSRQAELEAWREGQPVVAGVLFFAAYVAVPVLSLPGAAVMTLAACAIIGLGCTLDDVEYGLIRPPGVFDDPGIHAAVVCASVGCPMLRNEAFVAERLDTQLDDGLRRFLSDLTRNRFAAGTGGSTGTLQVSRLFDWYRKDFEQGHRGFDSLQTLFARHADVLADTPAAQGEIRAGRAGIAFLDHDWSLHDAR